MPADPREAVGESSRTSGQRAVLEHHRDLLARGEALHREFPLHRLGIRVHRQDVGRAPIEARHGGDAGGRRDQRVDLAAEDGAPQSRQLAEGLRGGAQLRRVLLENRPREIEDPGGPVDDRPVGFGNDQIRVDEILRQPDGARRDGSQKAGGVLQRTEVRAVGFGHPKIDSRRIGDIAGRDRPGGVLHVGEQGQAGRPPGCVAFRHERGRRDVVEDRHFHEVGLVAQKPGNIGQVRREGPHDFRKNPRSIQFGSRRRIGHEVHARFIDGVQVTPGTGVETIGSAGVAQSMHRIGAGRPHLRNAAPRHVKEAQGKVGGAIHQHILPRNAHRPGSRMKIDPRRRRPVSVSQNQIVDEHRFSAVVVDIDPETRGPRTDLEVHSVGGPGGVTLERCARDAPGGRVDVKQPPAPRGTLHPDADGITPVRYRGNLFRVDSGSPTVGSAWNACNPERVVAGMAVGR